MIDAMEEMIPQVANTTSRNANLLKNKPVLVTCLLAILSFILIFTQSILNWIKNLTTDERVWQRALELMRTYKNSTDQCEK